MNGDGFADIVIGATQTDTTTAEDAGSAFVVFGHRANEAVSRHGTEIDNRINGGYGNDKIFGYAGDDTIRGSAGRDNLEGGADADRFIFAEGAGLDKIRDFEQGLDVIEFLDLEFADLSITSGGRQALIEYGASDAITIRSMDGNPFTLTVDDFAFS